MVGEYLDAMSEEMDGAMEALHKELNTVRTGRASPKLLDTVVVTVASYGATMPINQLATVSTPDARMLLITPWDKSTIADIEKAITVASLGLNPASDGQVVRVPIPPLTGDRRQELTRQVRRSGEDFKVRIRGVRREYNEVFKGLESDKDISKDDLERVLKQVQSATDDYVSKIDVVVAAKEQEILEV